MPSVGVVIPITGDLDYWRPLADRAAVSVERQTILPDEYVLSEGKTLQEARNDGAAMLSTGDLIFLDADDELDPGYIEAMLGKTPGTNILSIYRPATLGVYPDGSTDNHPVMLTRTDLRQRNCIVIGAMCRRDIFMDVGGFADYPVLEDFALWRSMRAKYGCSIVDVPNAIYRVHVRENSRNSDQALHNKVYRQILKDIPL